jgi:glycosyltransferase involved in cell wall biosynthesis
MTLPLVSCIIPSYNRPHYVCEAVDSALAQTYEALEVIVVDDGSTDNTLEVLKKYGDKIKVLDQPNAGTAAARNTGVAASSGKYLAWLDSDDSWLPQKISAQVEAAERHPEAAVVYTLCQQFDENGEPPPPAGPIAIPVETVQKDILNMLIVESQVMPSSCLIRRDNYLSVGGYDPEYRFSEDWELDFRLALRYQYVSINAPLTRYRVHPASKSNDRAPHAFGRLKLREKIEASCLAMLAENPDPILKDAYAQHQKKYALTCYRTGKISLKQKNYAQAKAYLDHAVKMAPGIPKIRIAHTQATVMALIGRSPK